MNSDTWHAVDAYFEQHFTAGDPVLEEVLRVSEEAGLPAIAVSPCHGKLLHILARSIRAERVLEVGTLGGYSTIWLARALPGHGRVVTIEHDPKHAEVARRNFETAGIAEQVDLREGKGVDVLAALQAASPAPFDLVFLDADKENNPRYFELVRPMARAGALLICDNIVRNGAIADGSTADPMVQGQQQFCTLLHGQNDLISTAIQTVGRKGYDGFSISLLQ